MAAAGLHTDSTMQSSIVFLLWAFLVSGLSIPMTYQKESPDETSQVPSPSESVTTKEVSIRHITQGKCIDEYSLHFSINALHMKSSPRYLLLTSMNVNVNPCNRTIFAQPMQTTWKFEDNEEDCSDSTSSEKF